MKDTKHIRGDFYSVAWVMPQGWDFGTLGVLRGSVILLSPDKVGGDIVLGSQSVHTFCLSGTISQYLFTGWERKVHVTHSVDLYSGQILV